MVIRRAFPTIALVLALSAMPALAQQAAPAQPRDPNAPVVTENYEDWTVRCFNVRGPAPCDMLQVAVNKQNQQRVLSVSLAFIPERNAYALQVVVPLGVSVAKGMTLNAGNHTMKGVHYNRCSRQGCFVEVLIDNETVGALGKVGPSTMVIVYPYGRTNDAKLPLSLKGFVTSVGRLRALATQRATRSGGASPAPAPATPAPARAPAPAPAPATPAPGH